MPKTIETVVYYFDELSPTSQAKTIEWYRTNNEVDLTHTKEDINMAGQCLGIEIKQLFYSGFCNQGDGASFTGNFTADSANGQKLVESYPGDEVLLSILNEIRKMPGLEAYTRAGEERYVHEYTMRIHVTKRNDFLAPNEEDYVEYLLRMFAKWAYKELREEYQYQTSDGYCRDAIISNEYTFTIDGKRFG